MAWMEVLRREDLGFLSQIFIKNGEGVASPKNINQSGAGDLAFRFNDGIGGYLDQYGSGVAQRAPGMRFQLDGLEGKKDLVSCRRFRGGHFCLNQCYSLGLRRWSLRAELAGGNACPTLDLKRGAGAFAANRYIRV